MTLDVLSRERVEAAAVLPDVRRPWCPRPAIPAGVPTVRILKPIERRSEVDEETRRRAGPTKHFLSPVLAVEIGRARASLVS